MNKRKQIQELKNILEKKEVNSEEFQDKFYVREKIQLIFPDRTDKEIYEVMERIRNSIRPPISLRRFVKFMVKELGGEIE